LTASAFHSSSCGSSLKWISPLPAILRDQDQVTF
jgi:hypothetical protein